MKVKELLKEVKAHRYTYYNVNKETIKQYQKLYNYLKRHQGKDISKYLWLYQKYINPNHSDYSKKYKLMNLISQSIIH